MSDIQDHQLNSQQLLERVEKTGKWLRDKIGKPNLRFKLVVSPDEEIKQDFIKQWSANSEGFHWGIYIDQLQGLTNKFIVAAYDDQTLTGFCLFYISPEKANRIQIQAIEGKQTHNPLKGYTRPVFNQIGLDIGTEFALTEMGVIAPEPNTIGRYESLLPYVFEGRDLVTELSSEARIDWQTQFEALREKGLHAPSLPVA